jgi:hypothetical protein
MTTPVGMTKGEGCSGSRAVSLRNFPPPCEAGGEEAVAGVEAREDAQVVVWRVVGNEAVRGAGVECSFVF